MGFTESDITRDAYMPTGRLAQKGYDWWRHSFTGTNTRTGEEKAFFVEFFLCHPAGAGKESILGQLPEHRRANIRPSYLMVRAGAWGEDAAQLHRFFAWKDVKMKKDAPFFLTAGDCYVSETQTMGQAAVSPEEAARHPEYMRRHGEMEWELQIEKQVPFNAGYGAGRLFRAIHAVEMYWHAEGMKTKYSGRVRWNGEEYEVLPNQSYGYADKYWGSGFLSPWVWLSSNHMKSRLTGRVLENSVFDIGGGRSGIFGVPLKRKLLGAFYYEGQEYEFNFSKFWTFPRTKFDCRETEEEVVWRVRQENRKAIMHVEIHCRKKDMLLIQFEAPDGSGRHRRLWKGGTGTGRVRLYKKEGVYRMMVDDIIVRSAGCEYGETDGE